ncbi:MAG: M48 family metalloprotease [Rhodovibrionaceae bacterium]
MSLIRDAEIENTIRDYATPIFQAAGITPSSVDIFLINDKSLNAFVTPGMRMFINTGLLAKADSPLQVIGVIAHETGHIAAGHNLGRRDELDRAGLTALAAYLLGLGAAILSGEPGLGQAVISGGADIALKGFLSFTRGQEAGADQAAARYLEAARLDPTGLRDFFEVLSDQMVLQGINQDPYLTTHPLTQDRINFLNQAVQASPYAGQGVSDALIVKHKRMQAKLIGFLEPAQSVFRTYPEEDDSLYARYARSIAHYRRSDIDAALPIIDGLIAEYPNDPYFHELRGQMLFEHQQIEEALPAYQKAVDLLPREAQLRLRLAQVQLALETPELVQPALDNLSYVLAEEPDSARGWRLASVAHARLGDKGQTQLALAEMSFAKGAFREAVGQARAAQKILEEHTPAWLRAQDLEQYAEREFRREQDRKN